MQLSAKKVKLIILSAIILAIALLAICICELVSIHQMNKKIAEQNKEITELKQTTDYYKNHSQDDKDFDFYINLEE